MTDELTKRIDTAFARTGIFEPFIAAVLTKVKREVGDYGGRVTTAATDGFTIWFNQEWTSKLTDKELFGIVLHEAYHIVLMHTWRRGTRDPNLFNVACDAIINASLRKDKYHLPAGGVDIKWVTEDMSSEEVYARLKKEQDENPGGSGGEGGEGGGFDGEGDIFDAPSDAPVADMEATIVASAQMAKAAGKSNAIIDRIIGQLGESKLDWKEETRAMMSSASRNDYSYRRFNRRYISSGLYLPSLYSQDLGGIVIAIDTSGSLNQQMLTQIATEINAILEDTSPEYVVVIYCDSAVNKVVRFERDEEVVLKMCGGGGTRFKPVFDYVATMEQEPCGLIYFTDMEGDLDELTEPTMPVLWCNVGTGKYKQPFGALAYAAF